MTIQTWLLFATVALVPAFSPGPAFLLAISNSLRYGAGATFVSAAGNALGLFLIGMAAYAGFGTVLNASVTAFTVFKFVGAAYLIYLGIKTWRDRSELASATLPGVQANRNSLFGNAFVIALTNPKAMILLAALFPQFMSETTTLAEAVILSGTFSAICYFAHGCIAISGGQLRRFLAVPARLSRVRKAIGALFVGFGVALATYSR